MRFCLFQTSPKNWGSADQHPIGRVLCLARSFIPSLSTGACEVWQPISTRTPETVLISFYRSCPCAFCYSAKECQVRLCGTAQACYSLPSSALSTPLPEADRPVAAPPSGIESHTRPIHLALGNGHLSLRMPQGTCRHSLILGWVWGGKAF